MHVSSRLLFHKRVIADGDLVALHVHSQLNAKDCGKAIVDIFCFEKMGKLLSIGM